MDYVVSAGFVMELCAISENLEIKRNSPLRTRYPDLFTSAASLKGQRNILAHQYGLPAARIDWGLVWETLNSKLESDILVQLEEAIQQEEAEEAEEEEGSDEDSCM